MTERGTDPETPHLVVCGTRTLTDYVLVAERLDHYTADLGRVVVCTGEWRAVGYGTPGYRGADLLAEQWAAARRFPVVQFPPPFDRFPKNSPGAFHARNREMVEFAAALPHAFAVAFWDGRSPGTASMIELLRKHGIPLRIVRYAR